MTSLLRSTGLIAIAALAMSMAAAAQEPVRAAAVLHRCGAGTCLFVSGRRADAGDPVRIAGHEVAVLGGRSWRVALPLAQVRDWSATVARSISVEVAGAGVVEAALPIGLLGHVTELADLDVGARH